LHEKPGISNILHLLLSVFTVGLWIPVWVLLGFGSAATKPRCQVCGMKQGAKLGHTGLRPASEYEKQIGA
jgi:hypothetical protein